jgi:hypothetical protein
MKKDEINVGQSVNNTFVDKTDPGYKPKPKHPPLPKQGSGRGRSGKPVLHKK